MTNGKVTIKEVYELIKEFREEMRKQYVTRGEFMPIKAIVYGMVGLILMGVATAILAGVVRAFLN